MKPTTKILIKAFSRFETTDEVQAEMSNFIKTIRELPGLNYGITYRRVFSSFIHAIIFTLKIRFTLPIKILSINISRVLTTEKKVQYKYYISVIKTKLTNNAD